MSGPRASSRVLELAAKACEAALRRELAEIAKEDEILSKFTIGLGEGSQEPEYFTLPLEWIREKRARRTRVFNNSDSDSDEDNFAPEVPIPRYRKLRQNLYKAPLQRPVVQLEECSHSCKCKFGTGCGTQCHNRLVYMECVPGQCPSLVQPGLCQTIHKNRSGVRMEPDADFESAESEDNIGYCENTAIQTRTYPAVEVFLTSFEPTLAASTSLDNPESDNASAKRKRGSNLETTPAAPVSRGYGLRLLESVRKGTLLIEYLGEVITAAEGARRMSEYVLGDDFYFMGLDNGLMLDAKNMGSAARFANHSCAPSCLLQKWTVLGECRLVLVAARDLPAGAEITYNYHYFDDSFEGVRGMKRQKCMCGARHCCGTIGGRVINTDSDEEFVSIEEMYQSCVGLQLLPDLSDTNGKVGVENGSNNSGDSSSQSSCADLITTNHTNATSSNTTNTTNSSTTTNTTSNTTNNNKKYSLDYLQSLSQEIRTCVEKNTLLGLTNIPTTRFISNSDHLVHRLNLLATELENTIEQANVWVTQYDSVFYGINAGVTNTSSSISNNSNFARQVDLFVAQELVSLAPKNVKIEQVSSLEGQIRTLLKAKRILDPCVTASNSVPNNSSQLVSIKSEHSSTISPAGTNLVIDAMHNVTTSPIRWDDLLNVTRLLLSALPLTLSDTYVLEVLRRYESYNLWVRQTLSPIVAGSASKSRKPTVSTTTARSNSSSAKSNVNVVNANGLDTDSTEFEEFALLHRLLDTYCLQERTVVGTLPSNKTTVPLDTDDSVPMEVVPPTVSLEQMNDLAEENYSSTLQLLHTVQANKVVPTPLLPSIPSSDSLLSTSVITDTTNTTAGNNATPSTVTSKPKARSKASTSAATTPLSPPLLTLSHPLLTDLFAAAQFYDSRLSVYMEKLQIESALLRGATAPIVHKNYEQMLTEVPLSADANNDGLYFANNVDLFTQWEVPQVGICSIKESYEKLQNAHKYTTTTSNTTHSSPGNDSELEILYCFCRLPETDGESSILTECSNCCNWFHPQCVNSGYTTLSAAAKQKLFLCPVCTHLDGQMSTLSYAPNEWNVIKSVLNKVDTKETKKDASKGSAVGSRNVSSGAKPSGGKIMMTGRLSTKVSSRETAHRVALNWEGMDPETIARLREGDSKKRKRPESTCTNTTNSSSSAMPVNYHPLVKFKAAPAIKNKEFITVRDVHEILENENKLAIVGSPVSLLLGLARKYCLSWQEECRSFLASDPVRFLLDRLSHYVTSARTNSSCTTAGGSSSATSTTTTTSTAPRSMELVLYHTLQQEAIILQRAMQLYLQLRLVRIRGEECTSLRQLVWVISTSALYRRTTTGSPHSNILSVAELSSVVAGGTVLFGNPDVGIVNNSNSSSNSSSYSSSNRSSNRSNTTTTAYTQCTQSIHTIGTIIMQLLLARQTLASVLFDQANKCINRNEARALLPQFRDLSQSAMVKTEDTFAFARIKCLSRTTNIGADMAVVERAEVNTLDSLDISASVGATAGAGCYEVNPSYSGSNIATSITENAATTAAASGPSSPVPEVYCWCRKIDSGAPMVCCDGCEEWFHCHCVGLNGLNAPGSRKKKEIDTYLCISCSALQNKLYAHAW